ncbi:MAG: M48 family metalloprotease [Deltaproteobacteria bacterium]|nr:M48 family metalloprotease [Deltaproteobacteria bacterium]
MFNNIIYFIVVLLIFSIKYPDNAPERPLIFSLAMLFMTWLAFAGYCRFGFRELEKRLKSDGQIPEKNITPAGGYYRMIGRLSVLAVFLFALAVYLFNIKYWLEVIPWIKEFSVVHGLLAISLFLFYLGTIYYFAYPSYRVIFRSEISRSSFMKSNFRMNIPILFPWVFLSLVYDLISVFPFFGIDRYLNTLEGHIIFFICFVTLLMIFIPGFVQFWWGCKPLKETEKAKELYAFLRERRFKYRRLLKWPVFEGTMMTAGIMGIVPRFRYVLVTDSLMDTLTVEELKAVLAHEMGHARYHHLLLYVVFFLGFMVLSSGLSDVFFLLMNLNPFFMKMISSQDPETTSLFYLILSVPLVLALFFYFRYVVGFFMRNFERQADLYSAVITGSSFPIISSLEKIAYFSGESRKTPSWHHFSISERIDCLLRVEGDRGLIRRHNRFLAVSFFIYMICIAGLGYLLNAGPVKNYLTCSLIQGVLTRELHENPGNISLHMKLAGLYHQAGKYRESIDEYEKIIELNPGEAVSLNNLAWLLVTVPDEYLLDKKRALDLAKKAVFLEKSPVFLDTLAEAYFANGFKQEALLTIKEAINAATRDKEYYESQLKKFSGDKQ